MTYFVSEIGGDGSGHERCWPSCFTSIILDHQVQGDPEALRDKLASEFPNIEKSGVTIDQAIWQCSNYQFKSSPVVTWNDIISELDANHAVVLLVNNLYMIPTSYPNQPSWHALHWVRLLKRVDTGLWLLMDPLSWLPQPTGPAYEGLSLVTGRSLTRAIEATPDDRAGISLWV